MRKLPIPKETKEKYPLSEKAIAAKKKRDEEIKEVIEGRSNKMVLIIGPCSADAEAPVMDYIYRLRKVQDEVADQAHSHPENLYQQAQNNGRWI